MSVCGQFFYVEACALKHVDARAETSTIPSSVNSQLSLRSLRVRLLWSVVCLVVLKTTLIEMCWGLAGCRRRFCVLHLHVRIKHSGARSLKRHCKFNAANCRKHSTSNSHFAKALTLHTPTHAFPGSHMPHDVKSLSTGPDSKCVDALPQLLMGVRIVVKCYQISPTPLWEPLLAADSWYSWMQHSSVNVSKIASTFWLHIHIRASNAVLKKSTILWVRHSSNPFEATINQHLFFGLLGGMLFGKPRALKSAHAFDTGMTKAAQTAKPSAKWSQRTRRLSELGSRFEGLRVFGLGRLQ